MTMSPGGPRRVTPGTIAKLATPVAALDHRRPLGTLADSLTLALTPRLDREPSADRAWGVAGGSAKIEYVFQPWPRFTLSRSTCSIKA